MKNPVVIAILSFLKQETKLIITAIKFPYNFVKEFSILRFLCYLIDNSIIPNRNKIFRSYILKNTKKWKSRKEAINKNANKYILITNVFDHVGYISAEILVGKNLIEIFNSNGIALLNNYNLKNILLYKSFGIKKIIILGNTNIFTRLKYFIKAYLIIRSFKNMDEFLKFNINNVEIGKAVYDHYLRFSGIGTTNEFKQQFYTNLSKCLLVYYQINKYLKKYNIIASVQSEKQFIPGAVIFQTILVNRIDIYSRLGPTYAFTVRRYRNINETYTLKDHFSKKLFDFVASNMRKEAIESGEEIIKLKFKGLRKYNIRNNEYYYYQLPEFAKRKKNRKIEKKNISKKELCKQLGWNPNTPIVAIFSSDMTDGVFVSSWLLFRDRLSWLRETLLKIKKINNVNWLVRPHPNDEKNKVITNTISEYKKNCSDCDHIKLFPNDITTNSIPKLVNAIISNGGSAAGLEYPCFGIPVITSAESQNTGLGYTLDSKSKEEYFLKLQNIIRLEKLSKKQIELAKIYIFIIMKLAILPVGSIAISETRDIDEEKFWNEKIKLLDQNKDEKDLLIKMMKIQVKNKHRHTIDYRMIKKTNLENALAKLNEGQNP
jgi:hypothetical protein